MVLCKHEFVLRLTANIIQVTDFAGGTNFVVLAVVTLVLGGTYHWRQVLLTGAVVIWGLRWVPTIIVPDDIHLSASGHANIIFKYKHISHL